MEQKMLFSVLSSGSSDEICSFINRYLSPGQRPVSPAELLCPEMGKIIALYTYGSYENDSGAKEEAGLKLDKLMEDPPWDEEYDPEENVWGVGIGLLYLLEHRFVNGEEDAILIETDYFLYSRILSVSEGYTPCWYGMLSYLRMRISGNTEKKDLQLLLVNKQFLVYLLDCLERWLYVHVEPTPHLVPVIEKIHQQKICPEKTRSLLSLLKEGHLPVSGSESLFSLPDEEITFVIPVRIDSEEREQNLDVLLDYLLTYPCKQIWVLEADKERRYFLKNNDEKVWYIFIEDTDPVFHRTKYLNQLLDMAESSIVGIWDTDVILPQEQIEQAVRIIRAGEAILVYPYDGRFLMLDNDQSACFINTRDLSYFQREYQQFRLPHGDQSVGGAFIVHKQIYQQSGGENEHFYGWGPEDAERQKRIEILGLPIRRVKGALYHLYHPRLENSCFADRSLEIRNRSEFSKVCSMEREELRQYVSSWSWVK